MLRTPVHPAVLSAAERRAAAELCAMELMYREQAHRRWVARAIRDGQLLATRDLALRQQRVRENVALARAAGREARAHLDRCVRIGRMLAL